MEKQRNVIVVKGRLYVRVLRLDKNPGRWLRILLHGGKDNIVNGMRRATALEMMEVRHGISDVFKK